MNKNAKNMTVALVGPLPPPSGGMANQTRQLTRLFGEDGVKVMLVQTNAQYKPAWVSKIKGVRALLRLLPYVKNLWVTAGKADVFHIMANSGWSWHLFVVPAVWIARLKGKPVIVNYRGGGADSFFKNSFRLVNKTLQQVDTVVVPSGFLQNVFNKWNINSLVVPNIIDLSRFKQDVVTQDKMEDSDKSRNKPVHIIVTRNLEKIYDIETAIRAFGNVTKKFPDAILTIAGSGPLRDELESLSNELGLTEKVKFTGRLDNDHMVNLYQSADIMVNPSTVDNMPISILEALACGVPVVSTDVGGIPYIVENEKTALLVNVGDHITMASAIIRLLSNPELVRQISAEGYKTIQQYSWPTVKQQWLDIYLGCSDRVSYQ